MAFSVCRYGREDGRNGFAEADFGREFREAAFRMHGLQPPSEGNLPRTITLLSAVQGEEVGSLMLLSLKHFQKAYFGKHLCSHPSMMHVAFSCLTKHVAWPVPVSDALVLVRL